jgi:hypothetical protein
VEMTGDEWQGYQRQEHRAGVAGQAQGATPQSERSSVRCIERICDYGLALIAP